MAAMVGIGTSALLMVAVVLLASMVPGGPVETRSFAHLGRPVFWGFNVFLISLGLLTIATAAYTLLGGHGALALAAILGLLYVGVFVLDLSRVFPKTTDRMPTALLMLEIADTAVAAALVVVAVGGLLL